MDLHLSYLMIGVSKGLSGLFNKTVDACLRGLVLRDVYVGGTWDLMALQELVYPKILHIVVGFHFVFNDHPDEIIWKPMLARTFTIKSAF